MCDKCVESFFINNHKCIQYDPKSCVLDLVSVAFEENRKYVLSKPYKSLLFKLSYL